MLHHATMINSLTSSNIYDEDTLEYSKQKDIWPACFFKSYFFLNSYVFYLFFLFYIQVETSRTILNKSGGIQYFCLFCLPP